MRKYSFLLVLLFSTNLIVAQDFPKWNKVVEKSMTYKDLSGNNAGKGIFKILAQENNLGINNLSISYKFRININTYRNETGRLSTGISLSKISLSGNTIIKDFILDSLLWPKRAIVKLKVQYDNYLQEEISVDCSTDGRINIIDLSEYEIINNSFEIYPENITFYYAQDEYQEVEQISELINYYYSSSTLIKNLNNKFSNISLIAHPETSLVFISNIELNRAKTILERFDYFSLLNVIVHDPASLLDGINKLVRFRNRSETLVNDIYENTAVTESSDYLEFCRYYCDLSSEYLENSKSLQPSQAMATRIAAEIIPGSNEQKLLTQVVDYYRSIDLRNFSPIVQCIIDELVNRSGTCLSESNFSDAFLFLVNARTITDWFDVPPGKEYNNAVLNTISGISSSYLTVGYKSLEVGNLEFASIYLEKANNILSENLYLLNELKSEDSLLNSIIRQQIQISRKYQELSDFEMAYSTIRVAQKICSININSLCDSVDLFFCKLENSKFESELTRLSTSIESFQYPDAYANYLYIRDYQINKLCISELSNEIFGQLTYSLFLVFLQQGEILLDAKQPSAAMENLLIAKEISQSFNENNVYLDSLILLTAEPVIIRIIEDGQFLTWSKKMDEALAKFSEASYLNQKYFNKSNKNLNTKLLILEEQILTRNCLDHRNTFSDAIKTANIIIKKGHYTKLPELIRKAQSVIDSFPECKIDNGDLIKLKVDNYQVISFFKQYNLIIENLIAGRYTQVIPVYHNLEKYANKHNISSYNINFHTLEDFILIQNLPRLTVEAINYYNNTGNPDLALIYLQILISQDSNMGDIKKYSFQTAKNLAKRDAETDLSVGDALKKYTRGKSSMTYFRAAYLKNRIIVPSN